MSIEDREVKPIEILKDALLAVKLTPGEYIFILSDESGLDAEELATQTILPKDIRGTIFLVKGSVAAALRVFRVGGG
jgi:hypothetical protein